MRKDAKFVCAAVIIASLTIGTMAGGKSHKLATCDGQHRRPANLYGSILPTVDPVTGISTPPNANGVDIFQNAPPATSKGQQGKPSPNDKANQIVPPISMVAPVKTYRSC